jgi:hypothetical protein
MNARRVILGLVLGLLLSPAVRATTTITGHVADLAGSSQTSNTVVRFTLRNCAGGQPRVLGTALIAPTQGASWYKDFPADANGNVSGTIYSTRDNTGNGNGDIDCNGSRLAVWYDMSIWQGGKSGPAIPVHALSGGTLDVTQVTPITTNPVITAPTGDTTYLRKDAGNSPVTGNLQILGSLTANNGLSVPGGTLSATGLIQCKNFENVRCVDSANSAGWAGTDVGGWINSAYADLVNSSNGSVVRIKVAPKSDGSCYQFSTSISFSTQAKFVLLEGDGTCLQWTSNTGTAMTFNAGNASNAHNRSWGMRGIVLLGPNGSMANSCTSVFSVTATGVFFGGTNGAEGVMLEDGAVRCFGTAIQYGNNTWATHLKNMQVGDSNTLLAITGVLSNTGEQLKFDHVSWQENMAGANYSGGTFPACAININNSGSTIDTTFDSDSFDAAQICFSAGVNRLISPHIEQENSNLGVTMTYFLVSSGFTMISNAWWGQDFNPSTVTSGFINNTGSTLTMFGWEAASAVNITNFLVDSGTANTYMLGYVNSANAFTNFISHTGSGTYFIDKGFGNYATNAQTVLNGGATVGGGTLALQNNCGGVAPAFTASGSMCWNFSSGIGELDFFDDKGAGSAAQFNFYDRNGGAPVLLIWTNVSRTFAVWVCAVFL